MASRCHFLLVKTIKIDWFTRLNNVTRKPEMHSCMLSLNNLKGTSTGNHSFNMQQKHSLHVSWACSCHQFQEIPSKVMTLVRLPSRHGGAQIIDSVFFTTRGTCESPKLELTTNMSWTFFWTTDFMGTRDWHLHQIYQIKWRNVADTNYPCIIRTW